MEKILCFYFALFAMYKALRRIKPMFFKGEIFSSQIRYKTSPTDIVRWPAKMDKFDKKMCSSTVPF